jgi:hypothetical protein
MMQERLNSMDASGAEARRVPHRSDLAIERLLDKEAIRDCLARFCHGFDRGDAEIVKSAYWPDATEDHAGSYEGPVYPWIDETIKFLRARQATWKTIGINLIRISGEDADVESYVFAVSNLPNVAGESRHVLAGARYLDRMQRRSDEWRILRRVAVMDWFIDVDPVDYANGMLGWPKTFGSFYPDDPAAKFFCGEKGILIK